MKKKFSKMLRYAEYLDQKGKHESADYLMKTAAPWWQGVSDFFQGMTNYGEEWVLNPQDTATAAEIIRGVYATESEQLPIAFKNVSLPVGKQTAEEQEYQPMASINVEGESISIEQFVQARKIYMPSLKKKGNLSKGESQRLDPSNYLNRRQQPQTDTEGSFDLDTATSGGQNNEAIKNEFDEAVASAIRLVQPDQLNNAWAAFSTIAQDQRLSSEWRKYDQDGGLIFKIKNILESSYGSNQKIRALEMLFETKEDQKKKSPIHFNPETHTAYLRFNDLDFNNEQQMVDYARRLGRGIGAFFTSALATKDQWTSLIAMINFLKGNGYSVGAIEDGRLFPPPDIDQEREIPAELNLPPKPSSGGRGKQEQIPVAVDLTPDEQLPWAPGSDKRF